MKLVHSKYKILKVLFKAFKSKEVRICKIRVFINCLLVFLFLTKVANAQSASGITSVSVSMPNVILLDIAPNTSSITLSLTAPTEAGIGVSNTATDNSKWINFTSAVITGFTRRVTAQVSGSIPNGINLTLNVASYSGTGSGTLGNAVSPITMSTTLAQTIINNIGGAFTGDGGNNGYRLTYTMAVTNYALLRNQTSNVTIIYTILDN